MNSRLAKGYASVGIGRLADWADRLRIAMPVIGPLVVILVAIQVFEHINDPFDIGLVPATKTAAAFDLNPASDSYWLHIAAERRARLLWATSNVCLIVISLAAIVISLGITIESVSGGARRAVFAGMAALLFVIAVEIWVIGADSSLIYTRAAILEPTVGRTLKAIESGFSLDLFERCRQFTNTLSLTATSMITFAIMAATQLQPDSAGGGDDFEKRAHRLYEQVNRLHILLYVAAAVLIAVVLSMAAWLVWPVALANTPELKTRLMTVASGIGIFWGVSFTLMLAAAYLPSAIRLNGQIRRLRAVPDAQEADEATDEARGATIERLGLNQSVFGQVTRLVAILSPAITGMLPLFQLAT